MFGDRTVIITITILYITAAFLLMFAAYSIYIRRYRKRGQMEMLNNINFTTSRYDHYSSKTQFLLELPKATHVELVLLDKTEKPVKELVNQDFQPGDHAFPFDPAGFENGIYFLSLKTDNARILRRITIEHKS